MSMHTRKPPAFRVISRVSRADLNPPSGMAEAPENEEPATLALEAQDA
jgi:hypothetical protein